MLGAPAQESRLHLLDAEGHDDPDRAQGQERDHHVGGVEGAEGLDDEIAEAAARLAADELADDDADR